MKKLLILPFLLSLSFSVAAEEFADAPLPPDIPDPVKSGEAIEPVVTIIHEEDRTIEEHRVNGKLYMVKVTPKIGKPYYLLDNDGDGDMETRRKELSNPVVPQWVLFSW